MAKFLDSNRDLPDRVRSRWSALCSFRWAIQEPRNVWPKVRRVIAQPRDASPPPPAVAPHQLISPPAQDPSLERCRAAPTLSHALHSTVPESPIQRIAAPQRSHSWSASQSECSQAWRPAASTPLTHSRRSTRWSSEWQPCAGALHVWVPQLCVEWNVYIHERDSMI